MIAVDTTNRIFFQNVSCWKKMRFELAPNKTSCNIPPPFTHQRLKHSQRTKINKTMPSTFPLHLFAQSSLYQNWKTNKYSTLTATELGPSVSESLARITKFYTLIDSEHKTHIKNGIWTVARSGTSSTGASLRIHPRQTVDWWTLTPQKVTRPDSHPTGE